MALDLDGVVDCLLRERYLLSALELLQELGQNGLGGTQPAVKLQEFFADPEAFPPDQLLHFDSLQGADPEEEEKISAQEKAAVLEYELRIAQEDIKALKEKLESHLEKRTSDSPDYNLATSSHKGSEFSVTGRKELNCAVKEYLVSSGYKLTAMTFCEEVDQDLDDWHGPGRVPNALLEYHRAFLSCGSQESKANPVEIGSDLQSDLAAKTQALENVRAEYSEKEALVGELREALEQANRQLDAAKAELALRSQEGNTRCQEPELDKEKVIGTVEPVADDMAAPPLPQDQVAESPPHWPDNVDTQQGDDPIQILAESLPKIVPYVLMKHREELLPLIICAIGRHPDSSMRDNLTHTLFNLIKRPDKEQRKIIMDACISLSKSIGDIRTETELLPQCWEQVDHKYEERRLLVADSCGELGRFVRPDMRSSLILSILDQLSGDPADIVKEAASRNLAILLPLFPNADKYSKVESMMFQLLADPSGVVVETTLRQLVPAILSWSGALRQMLLTCLHRMLGFAKSCPPISGVEASSQSQLRFLGEKERWNIEVLLRLLVQLLPNVRHACNVSYPVAQQSDEKIVPFFSKDLLEQYLEGSIRCKEFDWMVESLFPSVLQLSCMLSPREETLRRCICDLLLGVHQCFGEPYTNLIVLPIFLTAVGDEFSLSHSGPFLSDKVSGLRPQNASSEALALKCILPLLLAGVLPLLADKTGFVTFVKELILQASFKHGPWSRLGAPELLEAIRFLSSFQDHHEILTGIFWELVVNPNASVKVNAALLLKELVPYASPQLVTQQLVPALVTLGSDTNLDVKYTSIGAFGIVAQHFRDDTVTDKIRVQMDAFLDEGSNEAVVAVVRALTVAVPLGAPRLRDYLLQKLLILTANNTTTSIARRRDKANAFCEAVRCLDGTDLSTTSIRELLIPSIQNLVKDTEVLDPAHKEALELILKERSGFKFEAISKVMGMSSMSMTSIFGEGAAAAAVAAVSGAAVAAKKDDSASTAGDAPTTPTTPTTPTSPTQEQGMLKRMMRTNFADMIRGRGQ